MRVANAFPEALGVWGLQPNVQFSGQAYHFPNLWQQPVVTEWSAKPDRAPWRAPERVRWNERQQLASISPSATMRSWVLAEFQVPTLHQGTIERLVSYVKIRALDEDGLPIATFVLNGQDPTAGPIVHPIPARGELQLRWRLTGCELQQTPPPNNLNGIASQFTVGEDLVPAWSLDQYGWDVRWGDRQQLLVAAQTRVRLWLEVGQTVAGSDFWFITATGRIGGYTQAWGPEQRALFDTTHRS